MFLHSRFVVVDDKEHHLKGIKQTLDALRLDCHSKLYDDETVGDWQPLPGTRILFLDQNLVTGATFGTADNKVAFTAIQDVIRRVICPDNGPYGLVLWAEEPDLDALKANLFERFTGEDARYLPVFFAALQKGDYIDTNDGTIKEPVKLQADIQDRMSRSPQMKALLNWETDVAVAAGAVLRSIVDLVPFEKRSTDDFGVELGNVLYRLAQAGAGIERAQENPRDSINRVLVPILADRITEHDPEGDAAVSWGSAIVEPENVKADVPVPVSAAVNSALHLSFARTPGSIPIQPTELGAVVEFPEDDVDAFFKTHFGFDQEKFLQQVFRVSEEEWKDCTPRLIQIGAACDAAQPKPGPLLYLFAVEWPFANADGLKAKGIEGGDPKKNLAANSDRRPKELEWQSPILKIGDAPQGGRISVFKNLSMGLSPDEARKLKAVYRFREELISQLTQSYARHISRPGIVSL
ncbi:hypothetical protein [Thioclava nitratireducens]|uniref:hypothetical protein n=1 Tax=Thioclava nitratireducens TaxID=1915078 RepID=UPI0024812EC3|nr:hypothetical protein [Thioclava nitratireducens]WGT50362.1 hypothetical protein P0N61_19030 [Thioclava nitratireducens]